MGGQGARAIKMGAEGVFDSRKLILSPRFLLNLCNSDSLSVSLERWHLYTIHVMLPRHCHACVDHDCLNARCTRGSKCKREGLAFVSFRITAIRTEAAVRFATA